MEVVMNQRVAVVTGSSSGFGRLTAETLKARGLIVYAAMRNLSGKNRAVAGELEGKGIVLVDLDVTSDDSVRAAFVRILEKSARIDVVVNNAGVMASGLDEAFTDEQFRAVFETNVFGVQRVMRAALPTMRAQGSGLFVAVSSNMAQITLPFAGLYTATKRALEGLVESYRYELAPLGIDSVIVEPGGFPTALFSKIITPADTARLAAYGPIAEMPGKIFGGLAASLQGPDAPNPQEVADAIATLVEAKSRPLRTVVDHHTSASVEAINRASSEVQRQTFTAFGMADLLGGGR
jgi:NAD(P)-dependent dehydrogenase (short-subunit alcohol dehydrogenase family)